MEHCFNIFFTEKKMTKKKTDDLDKELDLFMHTQYPEQEPDYDERAVENISSAIAFNDITPASYDKILKPKSMNILALDVATKTGWCTKTAHGTWDFSLKRDESAGMRLVRFKAKLREMCALEEIKLVTFELSQGFHQNAVIVQSELHGVLKLFCEENKIDYRSFAPSEIKKFATGKGNANKEKMIEAALKYGYFGNDDNTADAMHIYHLTMKSLNL